MINQDGSVNSPDSPAIRGQAIVIYATGLGSVTRQSNQLNTVTRPVMVVIGSQELAPFFAGLTPGYVGLYQVNFRIPADLAATGNVSVKVTEAGVDSNTVTIAVR